MDIIDEVMSSLNRTHELAKKYHDEGDVSKARVEYLKCSQLAEHLAELKPEKKREFKERAVKLKEIAISMKEEGSVMEKSNVSECNIMENSTEEQKPNITIDQLDLSEINFQLKKLFSKYSDIFAYHQWPSEHERWVELIFALVSRISYKPGDEVRRVVEDLDDLELLDIGALSKIPDAQGYIDLNSTIPRRIVEVLSESGFTDEDSKKSVITIFEAARGLTEHHNGKIQKYLRKYGQQMLDDISRNFSFSKINNNDLKYAFTFWLQNVLSMPVSLEDEYIEKFCRKIQKKPEELWEVTDKLDINFAILDDMVKAYITEAENDHKSVKIGGVKEE